MAEFSDFNFDPFQTDFSFGNLTPTAQADVKGPPTLGILLIEMGALSSEQLDEAVKLQQDQGAPLAQVLLEGGFCSQDQVITALRARPNYG